MLNLWTMFLRTDCAWSSDRRTILENFFKCHTSVNSIFPQASDASLLPIHAWTIAHMRLLNCYRIGYAFARLESVMDFHEHNHQKPIQKNSKNLLWTRVLNHGLSRVNHGLVTGKSRVRPKLMFWHKHRVYRGKSRCITGISRVYHG